MNAHDNAAPSPKPEQGKPQNMRKAFEAWMKLEHPTQPLRTNRLFDGEIIYLSAGTQHKWIGYQARCAQAVPVAAKTYTREEVQQWRDDIAHAAAGMVERALQGGGDWSWLVNGIRSLAKNPAAQSKGGK